jgi:predicted Fe-S protein YdhL (DUF1289 family)
METPCVKICTYEPGWGLCSGCGRTLAEVREWFTMTDAQRRAVMEQLPERLRQARLSPANPIHAPD